MAAMLASYQSIQAIHDKDFHSMTPPWKVLFGPIPSKNTFVHFPKSEPKEIQRSSSSPGQLQSLCVARDGPTFFARGDVSSAEPVAGTCAHGSETKQKEGLKTQKLLNRELVLAASGPDAALQVLQLASSKLEEMNDVNISTALHRICRACQGRPDMAQQIKSHADFQRLVRAAEKLLADPKKMAAKCCTVIAWSLASLRIFKASLFGRLAERLAASADLSRCEPYEITNLLWAYAVLCRQRRNLGGELLAAVQALSATLTEILRRASTWKTQVLVSALVSLAVLPWQSSSLPVFISILDELFKRQELTEENARPLKICFEELQKRQKEAYSHITAIICTKFPAFLKFVGGHEQKSALSNRKR